jgi:hypothetical protein
MDTDGTTSSATEASPDSAMYSICCTGRQVRLNYSTTARAPVKAGAASQCPPDPDPDPVPATTASVIDSWRWNRLCLSMNASTVRRNSSASSAPQRHARADTDDRRRRPFSDSVRRSSGAAGGDAARRTCSSRGPAAIFSDLLRRGAARASLLARAATGLPGLSSDAGAGGGALKASSDVEGAGGAVGAPANEDGKTASCGGGGPAVVLVCCPPEAEENDDEEEERSRSRRDSARSRSTMAFPRTKTKRALRRSDPARRSAAAAAEGTRDDDQDRNATSARSSPTRSIRYRSRRRIAAPAAAMAGALWFGMVPRAGAWVLEEKLN